MKERTFLVTVTEQKIIVKGYMYSNNSKHCYKKLISKDNNQEKTNTLTNQIDKEQEKYVQILEDGTKF